MLLTDKRQANRLEWHLHHLRLAAAHEEIAAEHSEQAKLLSGGAGV